MPTIHDAGRAGAVRADTAGEKAKVDTDAVLDGVQRSADTPRLAGNIDRSTLDGVVSLIASDVAGYSTSRGAPAAGATGPAGMTALEQKEAIVAAWTKNWDGVVPKLDKATHDKLAAEYTSQIAARQLEIAPGGEVARTLHRKGVFATRGKFTVSDAIPEALRFGPFANPGAQMDAVVRLSNASGKDKADDENDLRGLAVRLTSGGKIQDLLATSYPKPHAKDTDDFIAATALLEGIGGAGEFLTGMPPWDAVRMLAFLKKTMSAPDSVATESYWSRSHFQLGDRLVEFRWVPEDTGAPTGASGDDKLRDDMIERVKRGPVKWKLEMRGFLDTERTPVDDGRKEWSGPWIAMGALEIAQNEGMNADKADRGIGMVEDMGFSIGNRWDDGETSLKGKGILNEFREEVYETSQDGRGSVGDKKLACPLGFG